MKSSTTGFLIGLVSGAAIGAAIGILYAPDKGSVTRKKLHKKAKDLKDELDEKFTEVKDYVNETLGKKGKTQQKEA